MTVATNDVAGGHASATTSTVVATDWTPTVSFTTAPRWITVPGSAKVYYVQKSDRPSYDLYRYDKRYYTYQRGNWYRAESVSGPYVSIEASDVPMAFRTVKQTYTG